MIIDLNELAKSLMFAEKAKEEAESLKRDNEELYKVNGMYIEQYQQDQAKIHELEEAYRGLNISLNLKIKQLYDENKDLRELRQIAALNHDTVVDCIHTTYQQKIDTLERELKKFDGYYLPSTWDKILEENKEYKEFFEKFNPIVYDIFKVHIPHQVCDSKAVQMIGKIEMIAEYIAKLNDERDHYKSRYEKIREILLPLWDDKQ